MPEPPPPVDDGQPRPRAARPEILGGRLREERDRQGIGLRTLAKRIGVSPSLVSQVERGRVTPSVGTLYAMVRELGIGMDDLFVDPEERDAQRPERIGPVQPRQTRTVMNLASGVQWERLTPTPVAGVDFQLSIYQPGSESCPADALMRHGGHEYGFVLEGRLGVTVGFDSYEIGPGDAISFSSASPHRLWNPGSETTTAVWLVVARESDDRTSD